MRKKRVLFITEATYLNTGYATYSKNILDNLYKSNKYEIAEFSIYGQENNPSRKTIKWKNYPNLPLENSEEYNASPANQFGEWRFERVCLDFKPDIVCLPPEEMIFTEDGFKEIHTIEKNDNVLTHTGKYRKVTKLMRREHNGVVRKIYVNGDAIPLTLTNEHPVLIYKKRNQTNKKKSISKIYNGIKPEFVEAKDVKSGDLVVFPQNKTVKYHTLNVKDYIVNYISDANGYIRPNTHGTSIKANVDINRDFGTLCGYIIGDGYIYDKGVNIFLGGNELDFVNEVVYLFKKIFNIDVTYNKADNKDMYTIYCNSTIIGEFFNKLINGKNKKIPKEIRLSSNECKEGLIKGLIRSDGCYKENTVSFCSTMKNLAYEYRQICIDIDIPVNISFNKNAGTKGAYEVNGYGESSVLLHKISQKKQEVKNHKKETTRRPRSTHIINNHMVASVKRCRNVKYSGMVYNISVDKDESYVSNYCVHNCSIRDFWMDSFIQKSPFRRLFKWIWMPTVDAAPQHKEWTHVFGTTDALITYSDWAARSIQSQMGNNANIVGVASPSAEPCFLPVQDRSQHRKRMGISDDINIIGTVMRNQRRKLFPALFEAFGKYLKTTGSTNTYLYCHTSYPDNGWDIGTLLLENEISSRVLFSYYCGLCNSLEICKFHDSCKQCRSCKNFSSKPVSVSNGVNSQTLADIYNLMDLYVQPASSEGFGLPQVEAAACGVPVATVGYSAMNDLIEHVGAIQIPHIQYKELETGCDRAVINPDNLCQIFVDFFNKPLEVRRRMGDDTRTGFEKRYQWEKSAEVWMKCIDNLDYADWNVPPIVKNVGNIQIPELNNKDFIKWACEKYLIDPNIAHSYFGRSLQRDLNYGTTKGGFGGFFYSDMSAFGRPNEKPFNKEAAIQMFHHMNSKSNFWEEVRVGKIKLKEESWLK